MRGEKARCFAKCGLIDKTREHYFPPEVIEHNTNVVFGFYLATANWCFYSFESVSWGNIEC